MDKDSIKRLGINPELFEDNSFETITPDTNNSIITLHMIKETKKKHSKECFEY